ncbi:MAG TPA: copper-binding protein [Vicinamibacterales bacterium]|nr:copper-binding protein [Vicinamibacterales bacterium]
MIRRWMAIAAAVLCVLTFSMAVSAQTPPAGKKEHPFKGKVEKVDPKTKMVTVNNENIPGWMMSMTMSYKVDKPSETTLSNLKPGDQITATVYDGDFQTLYNVKVAPPAKK